MNQRQFIEIEDICNKAPIEVDGVVFDMHTELVVVRMANGFDYDIDSFTIDDIAVLTDKGDLLYVKDAKSQDIYKKIKQQVFEAAFRLAQLADELEWKDSAHYHG